MRILPKLILPLLVLGLASVPSEAEAQARSGVFASTFEMVVDNCDGAGTELDKARVAITLSGPALLVKIPTLPDMKGNRGKRDKLRAMGTSEDSESAMRTKFSFNGRVLRGKLQAVLVAEIFKGDKPQCTQSWSVSGTRSK
jgi:hypothetical protein